MYGLWSCVSLVFQNRKAERLGFLEALTGADSACRETLKTLDLDVADWVGADTGDLASADLKLIGRLPALRRLSLKGNSGVVQSVIGAITLGG